MLIWIQCTLVKDILFDKRFAHLFLRSAFWQTTDQLSSLSYQVNTYGYPLPASSGQNCLFIQFTMTAEKMEAQLTNFGTKESVLLFGAITRKGVLTGYCSNGRYWECKWPQGVQMPGSGKRYVRFFPCTVMAELTLLSI